VPDYLVTLLVAITHTDSYSVLRKPVAMRCHCQWTFALAVVVVAWLWV